MENAAYVNLWGPQKTQLRMDAGQSVVWVVQIDAYPDPLVTWSKDGDEDVIRQQSKFSVENSSQRSQLQIADVKLEDAGVYQVPNANLFRLFVGLTCGFDGV